MPRSGAEAYTGQHAACLAAIQQHYSDDLKVLGYDMSALQAAS
jgi:hypothetical protein